MIRLSLLFNHEDVSLHRERINLARSRMATAEDEMRFLTFIDAMPLDIRARLLPSWRKQIIAFTFRKDGSDSSSTDVGGGGVVQKLLKEQLEELEIDYVRLLKKGILLREMEFQTDHFNWRAARI